MPSPTTPTSFHSIHFNFPLDGINYKWDLPPSLPHTHNSQGTQGRAHNDLENKSFTYQQMTLIFWWTQQLVVFLQGTHSRAEKSRADAMRGQMEMAPFRRLILLRLEFASHSEILSWKILFIVSRRGTMAVPVTSSTLNYAQQSRGT